MNTPNDKLAAGFDETRYPADFLVHYVRGKTMSQIVEAARRVDRALAGGALALGAGIEIVDSPGYFPLTPDASLQQLTARIMTEIPGGEAPLLLPHGTGSTDLGDLSTLMPVVHPYVGGVGGSLHSADYTVTEPDTAYLLGAKLLTALVLELLRDSASAAQEIIRQHTPVFTAKEAYFAYIDSLFATKCCPPFDQAT